MVVGGIVALAALGLAFFFKDEIGLFLKGFKAQAEVADVVGGAAATAGKNLASNLTLTPLADDPLFGTQGVITTIPKTIADLIEQGQTNFESNIVGINATLAEAQRNLEAFAAESQKNIEDTVNSIVKDTQDFFGSFGGQQAPKQVIKTVQAAPLIQTQSGQTFDTSFLTPVDVLEEESLFVGSNVVTDLSDTSRFSGTGSLR